jgi:hypothetical protein
MASKFPGASDKSALLVHETLQPSLNMPEFLAHQIDSSRCASRVVLCVSGVRRCARPLLWSFVACVSVSRLPHRGHAADGACCARARAGSRKRPSRRALLSARCRRVARVRVRVPHSVRVCARALVMCMDGRLHDQTAALWSPLTGHGSDSVPQVHRPRQQLSVCLCGAMWAHAYTQGLRNLDATPRCALVCVCVLRAMHVLCERVGVVPECDWVFRRCPATRRATVVLQPATSRAHARAPASAARPAWRTCQGVAATNRNRDATKHTTPRLNLASFVTTFMEPECEKLMVDAISVNYIDTEECVRATQLRLGVSHCVTAALLARVGCWGSVGRPCMPSMCTRRGSHA